MVIDARDRFHERAVTAAIATYKKVGHFETKDRLPRLSSNELRAINADALKRMFTKGK